MEYKSFTERNLEELMYFEESSAECCNNDQFCNLRCIDNKDIEYDDDTLGIIRLWQAIFTQQLIDALTTSKKKDNIKNKAKAIKWLTNKETQHEVESFSRICGLPYESSMKKLLTKLGKV